MVVALLLQGVAPTLMHVTGRVQRRPPRPQSERISTYTSGLFSTHSSTL
jgi:hypothetical protein